MAEDPFGEALRLQSAAAAEGFDWDDASGLWDKLHEEIAELREAADERHRHEELGDLLFMVVNLARHLKLDVATALASTNTKFRRRYDHVRAHLDSLPPLGDPARLDAMEAWWQDAKRLEKVAAKRDSGKDNNGLDDSLQVLSAPGGDGGRGATST